MSPVTPNPGPSPSARRHMAWRCARAERARSRRRICAALAVLVVAAGDAGLAFGDHGVGLRSPGLSPMASALIFGGLALLVGVVVVLVVTVLTRRPNRTDAGSGGDP